MKFTTGFARLPATVQASSKDVIFNHSLVRSNLTRPGEAVALATPEEPLLATAGAQPEWSWRAKGKAFRARSSRPLCLPLVPLWIA
eukprot:392163-Amphidinium_carterae.1